MPDETILVVQTVHSDPMKFSATISDGRNKTHHIITLSNSQFAKLRTGGVPPERLIEAGLRFLLDREPKEMIMDCFDLPAIAQYFPEFDRELPLYLSKDQAPNDF